MNEFIMMPIPTSKFAAVCALLGGASLTALAASPALSPDKPSAPQPDAPNPAPIADASSGGDTAGTASDDGTLDAAGWPWSPELHASTKGMTKDGLWRMKVGVTRPGPKPGFPKETGGTGTESNGAASPASGTATSAAAGPATDDDDEFAAFRTAVENSNGTDAAAAAAVPARKWSDADLGALCNQAAVKLGDPAPVKAIIQEFVPADAVPHSRNIPDDKREAFAKAVEAKAGIEFAG